MRMDFGFDRFSPNIGDAWLRLPGDKLFSTDDMRRFLEKYCVLASSPRALAHRYHLKHWSRINLAAGNAESLPAPEKSQDAVTNIFVFHELPPKVRRIVFRECARVLKPGGRLVLVDSLQRGDQPDYEGLLELFPQNYHEPYCRNYIKEDFRALAAACGLTHIRGVRAFVSKVMVFDKPVMG